MQDQSRRLFMKAGSLALAGGLLLPGLKAQAQDTPLVASADAPMDTLTAIRTRRSIRAYTRAQVSEEQIEILLRAAMAAPSAGNEQPWEFILIRDAEKLAAVKDINRFAAMAANAPLGILTCVNEERVRNEGYGILDVSICTAHILLAAHAIGLGAVWTGIYPQQERVSGFRTMFGCPEHIVPLALVVLGTPRPAAYPGAEDRYDPGRIHQEQW